MDLHSLDLAGYVFHGHIHDRSPLILPETFWEHWLDPNLTDKGQVQVMINTVPDSHLEPYEVGAAVNSAEQ